MVVTRAILITCPRCGHNNKPHKRVKESLRLWLTDTLPPCKQCGFQLRKEDYVAPKGTPHLNALKQELGL